MTRVLVSVPDLSLPGGVTELFNALRLDREPGIEYFSVNYNTGRYRFLFLPLIYFRFLSRIGELDVIHLNPSMDFRSYWRDMIFCLLVRWFSAAKLIVYWHGWDQSFFDRMAYHAFGRMLFRATFGYADQQIVLARQFALGLQSLSVPVDTITIESNSTPLVPLVSIQQNLEAKDQFNLLYVSRLVDQKGWDIALYTLLELNSRDIRNIHLYLAGDGPMFARALALCKTLNLDNVSVVGAIHGLRKEQLFCTSDVFLFPTCYSEGMPLVLLEAMMHGMAIVTRSVGGIPDHINNDCGLITNSMNPSVFADYIQTLIDDHALLNQIRNHNRKKAISSFSTESQYERLMHLYAQLGNSPC